LWEDVLRAFGEEAERMVNASENSIEKTGS
jgi:hypothetical protein